VKMGRPPDPIPLKLLKGRGRGLDNTGSKVPAAPAFERRIPEVPAGLGDAGQDLWARIVPGLDRLGLLKAEDFAALVALCEAWDDYRRAVDVVKADGLICVNPSTKMSHVHPAQKVVETARMQVLKFAGEFGLTPRAEVALAKPPVADSGEDPFAVDQLG
jgi:P27 family predicted phage terminase small subunit